MSNIDFCNEIGEKAHKEHGIETSLDEMSDAWMFVEFQLKPHKNTKIIKGYDDLT